MAVKTLPPRDKARMSVNALTEYCQTDAGRRQQIIKEQKTPDTFRVNYYVYARNAIAAYLIGGQRNKDLLSFAISRLHDIEADSATESTRILCNTDAIECFLRMPEAVDMCGLSPIRTATDFPKLTISGVDVSIWPDITLHGRLRRHGKVVGGILFLFSKRDGMRLDDGTAQVPTSLLREVLLKNSKDCKVLRESSIVIDVFGQRIFTAPLSYRSVMKKVSAACAEAKLHWDNMPG